ncbi:8177_t:CDS:2, partial [Paraglomus occultum]
QPENIESIIQFLYSAGVNFDSNDVLAELRARIPPSNNLPPANVIILNPGKNHHIATAANQTPEFHFLLKILGVCFFDKFEKVVDYMAALRVMEMLLVGVKVAIYNFLVNVGESREW